MEDDCEIQPMTRGFEQAMIKAVSELPWDIIYFGHRLEIEPGEEPPLARRDGPIMCAHMYAVNRSVLSSLFGFLELVVQRPAGHPERGSQDHDGALKTFRAQNEDVVTLIASPSVAQQRSSPKRHSRPMVRSACGSAANGW